MMHAASDTRRRRMRGGAAAIFLLALAGCATRQALDAQLASSRAAVEQARIAGQPGDYNIARDKLARATAAAANQDNVLALRLAEEAQVDAELAQVKANAARAIAAAAEVEQSNQALRDVINRAATPAGAKP